MCPQIGHRVINRLLPCSMNTDWIFLASAFAALAIALLAITIAVKTAVTSARVRATTAGPALSRRLEELEATQIELMRDLKRVRSRYAMAEHRAKTGSPSEPDWKTEPEAWRTYWDREISKRRRVQ